MQARNECEIRIRRTPDEPDRYELRFRVHQVRGTLRIPSNSGAESMPACDRGGASSIRAQDLGGSQFFVLGAPSDLSSKRSRPEFTFHPDTIRTLDTLSQSAWTPICANAMNQLHLMVPIKAESEDAHSMMLDPKKQAEPKSPAGLIVTQSCSAAIEKELARSRRHVSQLKKRIQELEAQVELLGGYVSAIILDYITEPTSES